MPGRTAYPDRQTPSLHDALPISYSKGGGMSGWTAKGRRITGLGWAVVFASVVAACTDNVAPPSLRPPSFSFSPNGTALNQANGSLHESGTTLQKGFNPTNPHHGDA